MSDLEYSQKYSLSEPKDETAYPVPSADWERLKRMIRRICPQRRVYQVLASISLGVFGSSIITLITLYASSESLPSWVLPTTWAFLAVSLVLGIALFIIDNQQKSIISESTDSVIQEMEHLEARYHSD